MDDPRPAKPVLLVMASTYPRWRDDHEPGFVHALARRMVDRFRVIVTTPSSPGASAREVLDGVEVRRFRYAPRGAETLVHDGGMIANLRRSPWKWLLLPGFLAAQVHAAWSILRREDIALVHAHWLLPQGAMLALIGLLRRRLPPWFVTAHGADVHGMRGALATRFKRFAARRAARVCVVSAGMVDIVRGLGVPPERIGILPMGVDLQSLFVPDDQATRRADRLLFVGRLVAKKGVADLVEALARLARAGPVPDLDIVGFGPEREALEALVVERGLAGSVRFLGPLRQADLVAYYRHATLLAAPFRPAPDGDEEGLGLVLVEAAGCGCPIVSTRLPAVADVLAHDVSASLVPPASPGELAQAIATLLADPGRRERQALAARARVLERYDWDGRAAAYVRLAADLCAEGRAC